MNNTYTKYMRDGKPFIVNKDNINDLFVEAMEYLYSEVLPLYMEEIIADPNDGLMDAIDDFLSNDSPIETKKDFISWEEALTLMDRDDDEDDDMEADI